MPWFRLRDGTDVHIHFGTHGNRLPGNQPCAFCRYFSGRLCDYRLPNGHTCSLPLCELCAFEPAPGKDVCPLHAGSVKAWLAGRTNSVDGAGP